MMRALLIEDDALVRMLTAEMLEEAGVQVDAVSNAEDALILLASGQLCDVLVTDVNLGAGLGGIELAESVRSRHPDISVVFVSGQGLGDAVLAPGDHFLQKPFRPQLLVKLIAELAQGRAAAR